MATLVPQLEDSGLEVVDVITQQPYAARPMRARDMASQMQGMQRIAKVFVESNETILQELTNVAHELCSADSAGISIEIKDGTDDRFYHWAATAGEYSGFLDAILPRFPSACGICLERGTPQLFRVSQRFFEILGVSAPTVTDGILLPWQADGTKGTIFVMAHGRTEAFDLGDVHLMQAFADFAALGIRQKHQQKELIEQAKLAAAAAMANDLAHQINNPLQSLTNIMYLAADTDNQNTQVAGRHAFSELQKLSALVKRLLALPSPKSSA